MTTPCLRLTGRVLAFVGLWITVAAAVVLAPSCYGRNCEGVIEPYGGDAGQGEMIDDNTWESGPMVGQWLPFPRQQAYVFEIPGLGGRTPFDVRPAVSSKIDPNVSGGDFVQGAGNIALIFGVGPNRLGVKNDTCSDYFLRVVAQATPLAPPVATTDNDAGANAAAIGDADDEDAAIGDVDDEDAGP